MAGNEPGLIRTLSTPFAEAIERIPAALKTEGFGVLTSIDVKATLKAKINADIAPYTILGACNPTMAYRALTIEPSIGLNLPCNVIVRELSPGTVEVRAVDPVQTIASTGHENLTELAQQVRQMLARALAAI
jgi:uncharacterized protein (DUF302 family)